MRAGEERGSVHLGETNGAAGVREETGSLRTESNKQARTEIEKVYSCP